MQGAASAAPFENALFRGAHEKFSAPHAAESSLHRHPSDVPALSFKKAAGACGSLSVKEQDVLGFLVRFVKFFAKTLFADKHPFADGFRLFGQLGIHFCGKTAPQPRGKFNGNFFRALPVRCYLFGKARVVRRALLAARKDAAVAYPRGNVPAQAGKELFFFAGQRKDAEGKLPVQAGENVLHDLLLVHHPAKENVFKQPALQKVIEEIGNVL